MGQDWRGGGSVSQHDNIDRAKEINALYQECGFMPDHFARFIADYEVEIRADEREKAAQRALLEMESAFLNEPMKLSVLVAIRDGEQE